jgi:hypothetical protein
MTNREVEEMGPPRRGSLRVWAIRIVAVSTTAAALVGGVGAVSAATTVSPDTYAQTICSQAAPLGTLSTQLKEAFERATQAFKAEPTQGNAIAVRQTTVDLFGQLAQGADQLVASSQEAGIPDVAQGARFANAVTTHLRATAKVLHASARQAAAIDVTSASKFGTGFQRAITKSAAAVKRVNKTTKRDPAFNSPPASLHALVVYMTTDASSCPLDSGNA